MRIYVAQGKNIKIGFILDLIERLYYTFCRSLPENILSLTPTSNSLSQKYIHFIQSTFISVDTQPFASKGIPQHQLTTINTVLLPIRDNKISITQEKYLRATAKKTQTNILWDQGMAEKKEAFLRPAKNSTGN